MKESFIVKHNKKFRFLYVIKSKRVQGFIKVTLKFRKVLEFTSFDKKSILKLVIHKHCVSN